MRNKIFHEFSRVLLPIFIRQNKIIPIILLLTLSWSKYQQTIHPKKVSILLMSRYRGGSSFLTARGGAGGQSWGGCNKKFNWYTMAGEAATNVVKLVQNVWGGYNKKSLNCTEYLGRLQQILSSGTQMLESP